MAVAVAPTSTLGLGFANRMLLLFSAPLVSETDRDGSPVPITPLPVQAEVEEIRDALFRAGGITQVHVQVDVATTDALTRLSASRSQPVIIHYVGHGSLSPDGATLVIESETGRAKTMEQDALLALLKAPRTASCKLAVLNACHSEGLARVFFETGATHVICVEADEPILDIAARTFAKNLYPALLGGHSVANAFQIARTAVLTDETLAALAAQNLQIQQLGEALKFRLLPAGASAHTRPLDWDPMAGDPSFPSWDSTNVPPVSADPFVGRQIDLHKIATMLRAEQRCVLLEGMGGMGKTALALGTARWHHERRRYADGVWFFDLRNSTRSVQARERLQSIPVTVSEGGKFVDSHALIVLDDVDSLRQEDEEGLVELIKELLARRGTRLLVTSRRDLPGQISYRSHSVQPIDRAYAQQAFQEYGPPPETWHVTDPATFGSDWERLNDLLDGYPFPIRLAATYMKQTRCSLHDLVSRLDRDLTPLQFPGSKPNRDTSLVATLDLSFSVLPPDAADAFAVLSLFPSGLTDRSATEILKSGGIESLETLLQYSMAELRNNPGAGDRRFTLPEPARRYAERHLLPGMAERYGQRALSLYHQVANEVRELLEIGKAEAARSLFLAEQLNIMKWLQWGYEHEPVTDRVCLTARITGLLAHYWAFGSKIQDTDILTHLQSARRAAERHRDELGVAAVLMGIGEIQQSRTELDAALTSYKGAYDAYVSLGDSLGAGDAIRAVADVFRAKRQYEAALERYAEAAARYDSGSHWSRGATTFRIVGDVQLTLQNPGRAIKAYEQSAELFFRAGLADDAIVMHKKMAEMEWLSKNYRGALRRYQAAVDLADGN